jgi:hypothetical protein
MRVATMLFGVVLAVMVSAAFTSREPAREATCRECWVQRIYGPDSVF